MFVEKWMTAHPFTIPPQTTISAAAVEMGRRKFRHLLIAEAESSNKKLLGIVSKYDIARAFPGDQNPFSSEVTAQTLPQPITTIMARNPITVEPYCPVQDAANILRSKCINALPVIRAGNLAGIITEADIFAAFLAMSGNNVTGCKVVIESTNVHDTLNLMTHLSELHGVRIINAVATKESEPPHKVHSMFYLTKRPSSAFVQDLVRHGCRLLTMNAAD